MKVFQALAPNRGGFVDMPTPVPVDDQVLVKVYYCGVCGTDIDLFSGNSGFVQSGQATYPIRLGHEWSGVVAAVGPQVTALKVGDRVVGDNYVTCGVCEACLAGDYNNCTGRSHVGTINPCWPGAYAEYYLTPQRHVYRLADYVSLMEAALCEPLSVAYGGIKKMNLTPDSVVAVIGTGPIAMAAAVLARIKGSQVYVIGRNAEKLSVAEKLGIAGVINLKHGNIAEQLLGKTGGRLANFILECSGSPVMINEVIQIAANKAMAAMIGFYNEAPDQVDFNALVSKEMTLVGIMGEYGNLEAVSKIMAENELKLMEIVTGVMPLEKCADAMTPGKLPNAIKTMIEITKE